MVPIDLDDPRLIPDVALMRRAQIEADRVERLAHAVLTLVKDFGAVTAEGFERETAANDGVEAAY